MPSRLASDLRWWEARLRALTPQSLPLVPSQPLLLYTDAEGSGSIAGVLISDSSSLWFSAMVPASVTSVLVPRKTQIYMFEILAMLAALIIFKSAVSGHAVVGWIDNQGALGAISKGSSRSPDAHAAVSYLWASLLVDVVAVKFFWVPSKLNISDAPSRGQAPLMGTQVPARLRWEPLISAIQSRS